MQSLAANVGDLKNVLTNVKVRGIYGEVQLALLLEQFLTPDLYVRNATVTPGSSERVEFAIKFPADGDPVLLSIDSKFPREDYDHLQEAIAAGDATLIAKCQRDLTNRIKACAKDISSKYINPPHTLELAILFIPTESLYAEILRQPGLTEQLRTSASPTIFTSCAQGHHGRNRIVISPMCQYRSVAGGPTDWHLVHLGKFAMGGAGIVFGDETAVAERARM